MKAVSKALQLPLTTDRFDTLFGQVVCYAAAIAFLFLSMTKLQSVVQSERDMLFGTMLALTVTLMLVALGLLIHLSGLRKECVARRSP